MFTLDTETGFKDVVLINAIFGIGEQIVPGALGHADGDHAPIVADAERELDATLEAFARGLRVIGAFNRTRSQMTLSDVARATDLPKPSVRRALYTLTCLGLATSDGRSFRLTPKIMELASAYLGSNMISTVVQPACERIGDRTEQSCFAAVLDGGFLLSQDFGETPVEHQCLAERADHHVERLEVAMDHAARMRISDRIADIKEIGQVIEAIFKGLASLQMRLKVTALFDQLRRVVNRAVGPVPQFIRRHNTRVLKLSRDAGFLEKARDDRHRQDLHRGRAGPRARSGAAGHTIRQQRFQCDIAAEVLVMHDDNLAHAALAQRLDKLIAPLVLRHRGQGVVRRGLFLARHRPFGHPGRGMFTSAVLSGLAFFAAQWGPREDSHTRSLTKPGVDRG